MPYPTVLFIGTLPPHPGGGSSHSAMLLSKLFGLGHKVIAISPLAAGHRTHDRPRVAEGVIIHPLAIDKIRIPSKVPVKSVVDEECRRMVEIARSMDSTSPPDVVLLSRADFKNAAIDIADMFRIPLVAIDHGSLSANLDGYFGYADEYKLGPLSEKADCIISVAEHRAARLRAHGIRNVVTITNAADTDIFHPGPASPRLLEDLGMPSNARVVAHISNMKPLKRIPDFLTAVAKLVEQDETLHALVVGEGTGRSEHEAHAKSLGLDERVAFTGWMGRKRLADLYRSVEFIVQPSVVEAASLVILEAIASRCPVVCSAISANKATIEHNRTGLLVPINDADTLANAMLDLLRNPDRARIMAAEAHTRWRNRTIEQMAKCYSETLSRVADSLRSSERSDQGARECK